MAYNNKQVGAIFGCHITFSYTKQAPLILQIPYITKYLDLSDSILCLSQISDTGLLFQYSIGKESVFFGAQILQKKI